LVCDLFALVSSEFLKFSRPFIKIILSSGVLDYAQCQLFLVKLREVALSQKLFGLEHCIVLKILHKRSVHFIMRENDTIGQVVVQECNER